MLALYRLYLFDPNQLNYNQFSVESKNMKETMLLKLVQQNLDFWVIFFNLTIVLYHLLDPGSYCIALQHARRIINTSLCNPNIAHSTEVQNGHVFLLDYLINIYAWVMLVTDSVIHAIGRPEFKVSLRMRVLQ